MISAQIDGHCAGRSVPNSTINRARRHSAASKLLGSMWTGKDIDRLTTGGLSVCGLVSAGKSSNSDRGRVIAPDSTKSVHFPDISRIFRCFLDMFGTYAMWAGTGAFRVVLMAYRTDRLVTEVTGLALVRVHHPALSDIRCHQRSPVGSPGNTGTDSRRR
jgi:hypothetical protein